MSVVPTEWTRMIANLRTAQVAQDCIKTPGASQAMRDEATASLVRASDAVIADFGILSERQVLGRITMFLARVARP